MTIHLPDNNLEEKRIWNLRIEKCDGRAKNGLVFLRDIKTPEITLREAETYAKTIDFFTTLSLKIIITPSTKIVKSLMTDSEIEIDYYTPHHCDPSTETYWSM